MSVILDLEKVIVRRGEPFAPARAIIEEFANVPDQDVKNNFRERALAQIPQPV